MINKSIINHHKINGNVLHPGLRFVVSAVSPSQCLHFIQKHKQAKQRLR